ncbi:excisionase family protein [Alteromonas sp. CYL-A6]|uniref:excisionase family protein n=1 Tax=Alteromonas nitratireducens TaxID=3390813 RepID=UPI0034A78D39
METQYIQLGWVYPAIIEELKGITYHALNKRRQRGKLIEGVHWKKVHGVIMFNYEALDQLFEETNDQAA